ncbi:hypothetical protein CAPTEDRAFT_226464 [Capitella teleta]|uniref:Uncharacterized protein n=1 Tax=Capitella teleta TaxID=283909 RepID=R7ULN2_CAPTE|nr:hypothetical protein CAPTEDRAFT_226464 [Capitella teleta]|eukprot:ELU07449.1 hypothetical protein CAPTEDRAFT_226464 [Capitella teleta]
MYTPTGGGNHGGGGGGGGGGGMYKFPSVSSIHSMVSMGYLPPGHGYIPKKPKPDKPYGPNFVSVMNRTWRGPGRKYIHYALVCMAVSILFFVSAALYFAHRNVARLRVLRTEVFGALFIVIAVCSLGAMFQLIYKARVESNKWRRHVKFKSEGLFTAAAVNYAYVPPEEVKLSSGTYGTKALKEVPRPARNKGMKSKAPSLTNLRQGGPPPSNQGRIFEKRQQQQMRLDGAAAADSRPDIYTLAETAEEQPPPASEKSTSSQYDDAYHEATTIPREAVDSRSSPVEPQRVAETTHRLPSLPPTPVRQPVLPPTQSRQPVLPPTPVRQPVTRTPPQQQAPAVVARPSPQQWKAAQTPSPAAAYPQRPSPAQWSAQSLPPVSRGPVTTLKSPQPTIQIKGATPQRGPIGESEL